MPAFFRADGVAVRKDMRAVMQVNHTYSATHIAGFTCMTEGMLVNSPDIHARPKTRWSGDVHCHRAASGYYRRNIVGLENALRRCCIYRGSGFASGQFLRGHESGFEEE